MSEKNMLTMARMAARVPIWFMRQAGRYLPEYLEKRRQFTQFLDLCFNEEAATEVTLQPLQRFPKLSAAIVFSDILTIPFALGQNVHFSDHGPSLSPRFDETLLRKIAPIEDAAFLKKLKPVFSLIQKVRQNLPKDKCLVGFAGAPWTLAGYMIEGESGKQDKRQAKAFAWQNPSLFQELIDILTHCVLLSIREQIKSGADSVQIFDTFSGVLPDDMWLSYCLKPVQKIVSDLKKDFPSVPVILFSKTASSLLERYIKEVPLDILSLDTTVPLDYAKAVLQPHVALQGNLDPELLVVGGPCLEKRVEDILETLASGPFIFNLGHGILPQTPIKHVERVIEKVSLYEKDKTS